MLQLEFVLASKQIEQVKKTTLKTWENANDVLIFQDLKQTYLIDQE